MGTIALEGLEFFSYHGFYAEEQKIGNRYSVDVTIAVDFERAAVDDRLSETVNYEKVYQTVAEVMGERPKLLEHIAHRIIRSLRERYPRIESIEVGVSKFNPPVGGVAARARVTMRG